MELYAGSDLHSNNSVVTVLDEADRTVYAKRLPNDLNTIMAALRSCEGTLRGVAVESTYNWYWLVDGLQEAGFTVHLVNTTAVKQYDGLKHRTFAPTASCALSTVLGRWRTLIRLLNRGIELTQTRASRACLRRSTEVRERPQTFWWRRRESNPRPRTIHRQLYMRSRPI